MKAFPWARRPDPGRVVRLPAHQHFYVVSDLHLGDGTRSDAFMGKDQQFLEFLEHVRSENAHLVICGDIIDFPQAFTFTRVLRAHPRIFRGLAETSAKTGITYVWGNHDYDIELYQDLLKWEVCSQVIVGDDVMISHGHLEDPYIGEYPRESATATFAHHVVERVLGTWIRYPLDHFYTLSNRAVWWATFRSWQASRPLRKLLRRLGMEGIENRGESFMRYWVRCQLGDSMCIFDSFRRRLLESNHRIVLSGHSHLPGRIEVAPGRWYVNDGSWTFRSAEYASWNGDNFDVSDWITGKRIGDSNYRPLLEGAIQRVGPETWWRDEYLGWLRFKCGELRRRRPSPMKKKTRKSPAAKPEPSTPRTDGEPRT